MSETVQGILFIAGFAGVMAGIVALPWWLDTRDERKGLSRAERRELRRLKRRTRREYLESRNRDELEQWRKRAGGER